MTLFMPLMLLLSSHAQGAVADEKFVLRMERHATGQFQQHALVLEKDKAMLAINSGDFCGPAKQGSLGTFNKVTTKTSIERVQLNLLTQLVARLRSGDGPEKAPENPPENPHNTRVFINSAEVTHKESARSTVERILAQSCTLSGWTPERAVTADLVRLKKGEFLRARVREGKKKVSDFLIPISESGCKEVGKIDATHEPVFDCAITGFGTARLIGNN